MVAVVLASACAAPWSSGDPTTALARKLGGGCPSGEIDHPTADSFVAGAKGWIAVDAEASRRTERDDDRSHTRVHRLRVREVRGSDVGPLETRDVEVHGSLLRGVDWVAGHGGDVYLGLEPRGRGETALFALVFAQDGRTAFAGECQYRLLWSAFHDRFGTSLTATLRRAVGQTGPELAATLGGEPSS